MSKGVTAVGNDDGLIQQKLDETRKRLSADFAALAWTTGKEHRMVWRFASGSCSARYRTLPIRPGRELAGAVYRIGRPLAWDESTPDLGRKRLESPLMTAEELKAAAAVPIILEDDIKGILLVGQRSDHRYSADDLLAIRSAAEHLGGFILRANHPEFHPASDCLDNTDHGRMKL